MATTPGSNVARKRSSKAKSSKKTAAAVSAHLSPVDLATRLDEDRIRERAYGIWIEEGRPNGRELAHWELAHHELQRKA